MTSASGTSIIIAFPAKPYVVIAVQMVVETITRNGRVRTRHDPPLRVFLLELVEPDIGGCAVVWDGFSYAEALDAASDWAADDVEVRDRVAETWGRA